MKLLIVTGVLFAATLARAEIQATPPPAMETRIYKRVAGRELQVDVFRPDGETARSGRPAIAFFHGGGWVFGRPAEFHGACRRYAAMGFVTFAFQYRLSINADGTYPHPDVTLVESVKDARSALRWLRANATTLGIDPHRIVVAGQSAGGQLAWSTVLFDPINEDTDDLNVSPRPDALLLYSSNYNTMEVWADLIMGQRRTQIWSVSPYHNLKSGLPPALAFHGREDATVPYYSVQLFATKTRELGNAFELVTVDGRQHYLGEGHEKYARYFDEAILERTDAFLREQGLMPGSR
ncbi:alpha/beta hydrolase [Oleiharenicola lentus]|jgi:acetyl esterase/lipase|uniref:Alpha/beta hydrolase n=1 Tax=Oleiharenicola lentus TaxID=2508720 RepID=A0A4V1M6E4_9BACT|nr:alpha/beta hydrolase [Oleiharenicola lentus]RXK55109.1 alpha/beta hydrolase [Oleiharenicola lentus]